MATTANVAAVVATIVAQIPAHAGIPASVINDRVLNMLNGLDTEVTTATTFASQVTEKNAIATKVNRH